MPALIVAPYLTIGLEVGYMRYIIHGAALCIRLGRYGWCSTWSVFEIFGLSIPNEPELFIKVPENPRLLSLGMNGSLEWTQGVLCSRKQCSMLKACLHITQAPILLTDWNITWSGSPNTVSEYLEVSWSNGCTSYWTNALKSMAG